MINLNAQRVDIKAILDRRELLLNEEISNINIIQDIKKQIIYNKASKLLFYGDLKFIEEKDYLLKKKTYQKKYNEFIQPFYNKFVSTGGSSGTPVRFPTDHHYALQCYENSLISRLHFEDYFEKKIALLWGHSHLMGTGVSYGIRKLLRFAKDSLVKTRRFSAYRLNRSNFENLYDFCLKNKPILLGYSNAVFEFARYVQKHKIANKKQLLSGIICTAETLRDDMFQLISNTFEVDIINEYGSAELGVIGFAINNNNLKLIWDSFIMEQKNNSLIITSLDRHTFPLIRYEIGDRGYLLEDKFFEVTGRSNDNIQIKTADGIITIHSELLTHIIKMNNYILNFTIRSDIDRHLMINIDAAEGYSIAFENLFRIELERAIGVKVISRIIFEYNYSSIFTIAGKKKWILKEYDN